MRDDPRLIQTWHGELRKAYLRARSHRFRIDVSLNRRIVGAHYVNPGGGEALIKKGSILWLSRTQNRSRALRYSWELVRKGSGHVGTNSVSANHLIFEAIRRRLIPGLKSYRTISQEVSCGAKSRLDLLVEHRNGQHIFIEVKNCHLRYPDMHAYFPDSKTSRSIKHLELLQRIVRHGQRASLFVAIQRADVLAVRPSDVHDPDFGKALRRAYAAGVEVRAFCFRPTLKGFYFDREVAVDLRPYDLTNHRKW